MINGSYVYIYHQFIENFIHKRQPVLSEKGPQNNADVDKSYSHAKQIIIHHISTFHKDVGSQQNMLTSCTYYKTRVASLCCKAKLLSIRDRVKFSLKPSLQRPNIKEQFFPVGKSRCSRINAFICSLIRKKLIIPLLSPGELHYSLAVLFIETISNLPSSVTATIYLVHTFCFILSAVLFKFCLVKLGNDL